jgi:hypothetical protein
VLNCIIYQEYALPQVYSTCIPSCPSLPHSQPFKHFDFTILKPLYVLGCIPQSYLPCNWTITSYFLGPNSFLCYFSNISNSCYFLRQDHVSHPNRTRKKISICTSIPSVQCNGYGMTTHFCFSYVIGLAAQAL